MKKLLVALLVLGLAAPAMAAEVGLYGSFRTHLGYYDVSKEYGAAVAAGAAIPAPVGPIALPGVVQGPDMDPTVTAGQGFDDAGTVLSMSGQSRFGAKAKVSDSLNAVFEAGIKETNRASGQLEDVYLRLAYGVWNFGAGSFMFGKNYTPATYLLYSNQLGDLGDSGEAIMLVGGITYAGRQPQLRLTFGGFEIAAIEHNTNLNNAVSGFTANDQDYTFPKFEAAYTLNTPMLTVRPAVGWQTYEAVIRTAGGSETEEDVTSYLGALGVQLRFNPVYINMTGSYTVNAANYGISNFGLGLATNAAGGLVGNLLGARFFAGDVEDSELIMGTFVVGAKFSPMLKVEAGMSYNNVEVDLSPTLTADQTGFIYYIQAPITVAPGVTMTPEVGMVDRGDVEITGAADADQGEMTYGMVSFRVDF